MFMVSPTTRNTAKTCEHIIKSIFRVPGCSNTKMRAPVITVRLSVLSEVLIPRRKSKINLSGKNTVAIMQHADMPSLKKSTDNISIMLSTHSLLVVLLVQIFQLIALITWCCHVLSAMIAKEINSRGNGLKAVGYYDMSTI